MQMCKLHFDCAQRLKHTAIFRLRSGTNKNRPDASERFKTFEAVFHYLISTLALLTGFKTENDRLSFLRCYLVTILYCRCPLAAFLYYSYGFCT